MSFKKIKSFLYCTAILLLLVNVNNGKNSEKASCQAKKEPNSIINIKASKAKNSSTKVVAGLMLENETLCMESCCSHSDCTLYVYYDSSNRPSNCFLLKCSPISNCIRSSLSGSVVGVIERNALIQATPPSSSEVDSSKLHTVSTVTSKDGVMLETTLSETPIGVTSVPTQQLEQREENTNRSAHSAITSTPSATAYHHSSVAPTQVVTTHGTTPHINSKKMKHHTEGHDHTNKTSLIIALFFGILFLLAVVVIVGRPWWDFMQRPRYSKVDYLMNGL